MKDKRKIRLPDWDGAGKAMKRSCEKASKAFEDLGKTLEDLEQPPGKKKDGHIPDKVKRRLDPPFCGMNIPDKPF